MGEVDPRIQECLNRVQWFGARVTKFSCRHKFVLAEKPWPQVPPNARVFLVNATMSGGAAADDDTDGVQDLDYYLTIMSQRAFGEVTILPA